MIIRILPAVLGVVLTLILFSVAGAPAFAASPCKGLSKTKCSSKPTCSWVEAYKTKSGTRVNSYCRARPGKGEKRSAQKRKVHESSSRSNKSDKGDKHSRESKANKR